MSVDDLGAAGGALAPTPDPGSDAAQQGRDRSRRLASGIASSLVSRGIAALSPLILVPITLGYLGESVYGIWVTAASVTSMVLWADFGLGNGLLTRLAPAYAAQDWAAARRYVSTTYALLTASALAMLGLLVALAWVLPWRALFNVDDPAMNGTTRAIALVCLSGMIINIPLSLVQRVQYASQQVAQSNLWQAAGPVASIAFAAAAVGLGAPSPTVVAATVAGPLVMNVVNSVAVYRGTGRSMAPRRSAVDRALARPLLSLGGQFFVLSIVTSTALNADNLIITQALGPEDVTAFAVPVKLFTALGLVVTLVNLPLWPANGEALARGDVAWVRRTTKRMTLFSAAAVVIPSAVLIVAGDWIIRLWTGTDFDPPVMLLVGLSAWWCLVAVTSPRFMVQNAVGLVLPQIIGWSAYLVSSIPLKWLAAKAFGVAGVPLVGTALYLVCVVAGAHIGYRRALERSQSLHRSAAGASHASAATTTGDT